MERCPAPGETVLAHAVTRGCGGKGANQAAAAARAGARVVMVGCFGDDDGAPLLRAALEAGGPESWPGAGVNTLRFSVASPGKDGSGMW